MATVSPTAPTRGAAKMEIRPVGNSFAAEIVGLDLREPLDADTQARIDAAFVEHHVLAFRDQSLEKRDQLAVTLKFGELDVHAAMNAGDDVPEVHVVSNLNEAGLPDPDRLGSQHWHSDKSYRRVPSTATFLYGIEVPAIGGDTCFADTATALEALPKAQRDYVSSLRVVHCWERSVAKGGGRISAAERRLYPPIAHPLARLQPSGRRALFIGQHASHIAGIPMAEGVALLDELQTHATRDEFVYEHDWRPGDLLIWDNRGLVHRALNNFATDRERRILHRTVTRGTEVPC
ncbi:MAG: TauD/TfdA family dioxygenase [Pseudomonadota bacterium]